MVEILRRRKKVSAYATDPIPGLLHRQSWYDDVIKWKRFPRYWPFVRVTGHRWIPRTKASDAELRCFQRFAYDLHREHAHTYLKIRYAHRKLQNNEYLWKLINYISLCEKKQGYFRLLMQRQEPDYSIQILYQTTTETLTVLVPPHSILNGQISPSHGVSWLERMLS